MSNKNNVRPLPAVPTAETPALGAPQAPTPEALMAEVARLREELSKAQAVKATTAAGRLSLKVSEKGALSIYGLGRFPVTLYASQLDALKDAGILVPGEALAAWLKVNGGKLTRKDR